jgi:4-hydroxy-2-oxoheptanedioate aldolase
LAELRQNKIKHMLQRGEVASIISGHTTPDIIDFLGPLGFDGVWIEGEHGPLDFADIPDMSRACDIWGMTSIVRVNLNIPGVIYRTLDVGAQGVVIPHVNTADEARAVVDASKFGPIGSRGSYTSRQGYGVDDYVNKANDETLVVILIEDIVAVNNLADIVKVDNIDVFFVAPGDLAQSMGHVGNVGHPEVQSTVKRSIDQITSAGRVAGALSNDSNVEALIQNGARFLMTGWQAWAASGARAYLEKTAAAPR